MIKYNQPCSNKKKTVIFEEKNSVNDYLKVFVNYAR